MKTPPSPAPLQKCSRPSTGAFVCGSDSMQAGTHFDDSELCHHVRVHRNIAPLALSSNDSLTIPSTAVLFLGKFLYPCHNMSDAQEHQDSQGDPAPEQICLHFEGGALNLLQRIRHQCETLNVGV